MNWYKKIKLSGIIKFNPSPEMINQINKWYDLPPEGEGLPVTEISKKLNVSSKALMNFFRRIGKKIRNQKEQFVSPYSQKIIKEKAEKKRKITSPEDIKIIIELYNEGNGIKDIADLYEISQTAITNILIKQNIPLRNIEKSHNTPITKKKHTKIMLNRWKNLEQQGIGFRENLENFLQKYIQKFPIEQRQEEYERKRNEILKAIYANYANK